MKQVQNFKHMRHVLTVDEKSETEIRRRTGIAKITFQISKKYLNLLESN